MRAPCFRGQRGSIVEIPAPFRRMFSAIHLLQLPDWDIVTPRALSLRSAHSPSDFAYAYDVSLHGFFRDC